MRHEPDSCATYASDSPCGFSRADFARIVIPLRDTAIAGLSAVDKYEDAQGRMGACCFGSESG